MILLHRPSKTTSPSTDYINTPKFGDYTEPLERGQISTSPYQTFSLSLSLSPLSCPLDRSFPPLSSIVCSPINYPRRFFFALGARTRWKIFPTTAAPGIWESWQTGKRFRTRVFQVLGCDFRLLFAPKRRRVCKLRTLSFSFRAGVCLSSRPSPEPDFTSCAGS